MSMVTKLDRIVRVLNVALMLLFLAGLIWLYAYMPDTLKIRMLASDEAAFAVSKNAYFYAFLGFFALSNLVIYASHSLARYIAPGSSILSIFRDSRSKSIFLLWLSSFQVAVGVMILLSYLYFGFMNAPDHQYGPRLPAMAVGPVLILLTFAIPLIERVAPKIFDD